MAQELKSFIVSTIFCLKHMIPRKGGSAFATFAGFSITDAAWISIGTMAVDVILRWEEEKQKRFLMLGTTDMLKYVYG